MSQAEDDLSILQQELRGLSFQIDAHHREDDARREKNQSRGDEKEGVFVDEVDSGEEVGVQADGSKRRRVGRFGGGSSPPRASPGYVLEFIRGMSEEDQATFKRNYGLYGGDDVSSFEGDKPQVCVHGQDMTETPCLQSFQAGQEVFKICVFCWLREKERWNFFKRRSKTFLTMSVPIVFFPGAERTLCSFLTELYGMGVAVLLDAGHLLEFKNSLLAAESGYSLHCLSSLNSLICHPSMHAAPSLASELFDGK